MSGGLQSPNHIVGGILLLVIPLSLAIWFVAAGKAYVPITDTQASTSHQRSKLVTLNEPRQVWGIALLLAGFSVAFGGRAICKALENARPRAMTAALAVGATGMVIGAVLLAVGFLAAS